MDDFVCKQLTQWNLEELISRFRDQGIDEESLYCLEDQDINDLIPKVGPRVRFKKRLRELQGTGVPREVTHGVNAQTQHRRAAPRNQRNDLLATRQKHHQLYQDAAQGARTKNVLPIRDREKRGLDLQVEASEETPTAKRQRDTAPVDFSEQTILSDVQKIMTHVHTILRNMTNTKFVEFLKTKIGGLETDKKELIGVFGRTGAGKSFLINAVLGQKGLLPVGYLHACTSVMIKVEASVHSQTYVAEIEFITKEEWKDELWTMLSFLNNVDQEKRDDFSDEDKLDELDYKKKLSAVYGEGWIGKTPDKLMERRNFTEIPKFLEEPSQATLTCESAEMLSEEIAKYTKEQGEKRSYWPLVKCVTVWVPHNDLLQHVTLIDLPGTGDRNKSRDTMWKGVVEKCSTVWVVTEINRAASEKEPWEILENAAKLLGNGGECQRIHFICTKIDTLTDSADYSNAEVKEAVKKEFNNLAAVKKQFGKDCFEVFTVSSKGYQSGTDVEHNEIPSLKKFLQNLNDCHSETLNYVSGAHGILSLMHGARDVVDKKEAVCEEIEINKSRQLSLVKKEMDDAYAAFEKCLTEGVEKSKSSCEKKLMSIIKPNKSCQGFHRILKSLVQNGGIYKPKTRRKEINLNTTLSFFLADSIDEEFRKTFPNERKCAPFNGVISKFSLDTERLKQKYENVKLQLIFLQTEEEKMQTQLNTLIRERKKVVYRCLTETIEENMKECYEEAATFEHRGSMEKQRETIQTHVQESRDTMFDEAKDAMLFQLRKLMEDILDTLQDYMKESIEIALKTDNHFIPDVSSHLGKVEKLYDELKSSSGKEAPNQSCSASQTQPAVKMENF